VANIALQRVIDDVPTLRALADPIRMIVLELTMASPDRTWTARELANQVGVTPTNIYYHLNLLERYELLQVRETRVVNGIIEKHYGAAQRDLTFHRRSGDDMDPIRHTTAVVLSELAKQVDLGLASGDMSPNREAPETKRMMISRVNSAIPESRIKEFREELLALTRRFEAENSQDGHRFTIIVAMHPGG